MPDARIVAYAFTNLTPGEGSDVNDAADANEFNTNWLDISVALGVTRFYGADCLNKAGAPAQADFYLRTQSLQHRLGAIPAGYFALVCDAVAGDYWEDAVQTDATGPFLQISDADYQGDGGATPGCTGAYTNEFLDWEILCFPCVLKISNNWIHFLNTSPGAVTGDDISVSVAIATKIGTYLPALQVRVNVALDGAGNLNPNVVTNASIDKDEALFYESDNSIAMGVDAEEFAYGDGIAYGLELLDVAEWGAPPSGAYGKETTIVFRGSSSQQFTTSATPEGFKVLRKPTILGTDNAGSDVTICGWVYVPTGANLIMGFVYTVGAGWVANTVNVAPPGGAGAWSKVMHSFSLPVGTTDWYGVMASGTAGAGVTYYVDEIDIFRGNVGWAITGSDNLNIVNRLMHQKYYNYIPFSDLSWFGDVDACGRFNPSHAWLMGHDDTMLGPGIVYPNFWGSATGVNASVQNTSLYKVGNAAWQLDLDINDAVFHDVGLRPTTPPNIPVTELSEGPATFSCWLRALTSTCAEYVRLQIYSENAIAGDTTTSYRDFHLLTIGTAWKWCSVTEDLIVENPLDVRASIINPPTSAGDAVFLVDGLQLTRTDHPIDYTSNTPWKYMAYTWGYDDGIHSPITPGNDWYMGFGQIGANLSAPRGPVTNHNEIPYGLTVYGEFVPAFTIGPLVQDTFHLQGIYWDEAATGWVPISLCDVIVDSADGLGGGTTFYLTNILIPAGGGGISPRHYDRLAVQIETDSTATGDEATACAFPQATAHCLYWGT